MYDGKVATTYFYSSSGGRTASIADVFAGSKPVPYLVSVPDPYDTASPWHSWGPVVISAATAGRQLGVPGLLGAPPGARHGPAAIRGRDRPRRRRAAARRRHPARARPSLRLDPGRRPAPLTAGRHRRLRHPGHAQRARRAGQGRHARAARPRRRLAGRARRSTIGSDSSFSIEVTSDRDDRVPAGGRHGEGRVSTGRRRPVIRRLVFLLAAAALVAPVAASGFAPTDPLSAKQWYLTQIHAFDFWPDVPPTLAPVPRRRGRLGPGSRAPGVRRARGAGAELRRRRRHRPPGPRDVRRRDHRGERRQQRGHHGHRALRRSC